MMSGGVYTPGIQEGQNNDPSWYIENTVDTAHTTEVPAPAPPPVWHPSQNPYVPSPPLHPGDDVELGTGVLGETYKYHHHPPEPPQPPTPYEMMSAGLLFNNA